MTNAQIKQLHDLAMAAVKNNFVVGNEFKGAVQACEEAGFSSWSDEGKVFMAAYLCNSPDDIHFNADNKITALYSYS